MEDKPPDRETTTRLSAEERVAIKHHILTIMFGTVAEPAVSLSSGLQHLNVCRVFKYILR